MKPFNLEEFKSGKKAVTRDGRVATFGGHNPDATISDRLVGWFDNEAFWWREDGKSVAGEEGDWDLIGMAPEKKTVWVNVWESKLPQCIPFAISGAYPTKEYAKECLRSGGEGFIGTFPLEIEV